MYYSGDAVGSSGLNPKCAAPAFPSVAAITAKIVRRSHLDPSVNSSSRSSQCVSLRQVVAVTNLVMSSVIKLGSSACATCTARDAIE